MGKFVSRRSVLTLVGATAITLGTLATWTVGHAASPSFGLAEVGPFGGEPYISSDSNGVLYDTSPSGPETFRSTNYGANWSQIESPDSSSGDDCINEDQADAAYWCNLDGTSQAAPLQAAVFKSTIANTSACTSTAGSCDWQGPLPVKIEGTSAASECGTTCSPFGVDRMWTAAAIPTGGSTSTATVALMYHDFYGPSSIWVNISTDGGASWTLPINVLASLSAGSVPGSLEGEGYTFCNTVPSNVMIVPYNLPASQHPGRIYVVWIASDPAQDATGCNITMVQSFHTVWISWSDNLGSSWTTQQVIDMGVGHDTSTPFLQSTIDDQGNPYVAWDSQAQIPTSDPTFSNPATCSAESTAGTVQSDASCGYNAYVAWSSDGGADWDGCTGGQTSLANSTCGVIGGSAGAPYLVNNDTGTDQFATIAVGDPGHVDVSWLHTSTIEPTDSLGKFYAGACAGSGATGNPSFYPPNPCQWNLFAAQSTDLASGGNPVSPSSAQWTVAQVTSTPNHVGDVCNLGIFCVDPNSDRSMLDFNSETIDSDPSSPDYGCAHIAYSDNNGPGGSGTYYTTPASPYANHLVAANQTSNCDAFASLATTTPEAPLTVLFIPAAAVVAFGGWQLRRRRSQTTTVN